MTKQVELLNISTSESEHSWDEELFHVIRKKRGFHRKVTEEDILEDIKNCLQEGADINAQNNKNETVLHVAVRKRYLSIIKYLLDQSARCDIRDCRNKTASDLSNSHESISELFNNCSKMSIDELDENVNVKLLGERLTKRKTRKTNDYEPKKIKIDSPNADEANTSASNNIKRAYTEAIPGNSKRTKLSLVNYPTHYKSSGLKHSLHGSIYQLKLHMLYLKRGLDKGYNFRLATEMDCAEKFDDLVFLYENETQDDISYTFLQAKHKQNEATKITSKDLLTEREQGEFGLPKYFNSYRKILKYADFKSNSTSFIICTNISFDIDELKQHGIELAAVQDIDDLLHVDCNKNPTEYNLILSDPDIKEAVYEKLRCTSDLYVLAKQLYHHLSENKQLNLKLPIFKLYHGALVENGVLNLIEENKNRAWATFRAEFIQNSAQLSAEARLLRNLLVTFYDNETAFQKCAAEIKFARSPGFGKMFKLEENPEISDCSQFTKKFFRFIVNPIDELVTIKRETGKGVIKDNLNKIAGHVLILNNKEIVVRSSFLENISLPGNLHQFKTELEDEFVNNNIPFTKILDYKFKINNYQTCEEDQLESKPVLPQDVIDDVEINQFFENIKFAVNQPNETELEEAIKIILGDDSKFNLLDVDLVSDSFQKEMLDWFKEKGSQKCKEGRFLSNEDAKTFFSDISGKINTIIGIGISLSYPKKLDLYNVTFDSIKDELKDFFDTSHKQILHFVCENTLMGCFKINQILKTSEVYNKQDSYIFLHFKTALQLLQYVLTAFSSKISHNLLIIDCDLDDNVNVVFNELNYILEENRNKKIVFLTNSGDLRVSCLKNCVAIYDSSCFEGLSNETKMSIMEKIIIFQNYEIKFHALIEKNYLNDILNTDDLVRLITEQNVIIGGSLENLSSSVYHYINRVFLHYNEINPSFLKENYDDIVVISGANEAFVKNFVPGDLLISVESIQNNYKTEGKRIILSDNNNNMEATINFTANYPQKNIHWMKCEQSKLLWNATRGSTYDLKCFLTDYCTSYTENDFMKKTHFNKIIVLSEVAGMGKTTTLTNVSNKIKGNHSDLWVLKINLNQHTYLLQEELAYRCSNKARFTSQNKHAVINFIVDNILKTYCKTHIEAELLRLCFRLENKIVLLFDSFDEISPDYEDIIVDLITGLVDVPGIRQIWITTRLTSVALLERKFGVLPFNLQSFNVDEQVRYVRKSWENKSKVDEKNKIKTAAASLVEHFNAAINDSTKKFTGIPLITCMLADVYFDKFLKYCKSGVLFWKFDNKTDLVALYEHFINYKFRIYENDKKQILSSNVGVIYDSKKLRDNFIEMHEYVALYTLLQKSDFYLLLSESQRSKMTDFICEVEKGIERTGIVNLILHGKPEFIHRTFAEFFVAQFMIRQLNCQWKEEEVFLMKLLVEPEFEIMRIFFNGLLVRSTSTTPNKIDMWSEKLALSCNYSRQNLLHNACLEGNYNILDFITATVPENIVKFLINAVDSFGKNCLHYAAINGNFETVKLLLEKGAEGNIKDKEKLQTSLHYATEFNHVEIVKLLLQYKCLHYFNHKERCPLHIAAKKGYFDLAILLYENKPHIIAQIDGFDQTPLDLAAKHGHWNIAEWFAESVELTFPRFDRSNKGILEYAACACRTKLIRILLEKYGCEFKHKIKTALRAACSYGHLDVVEILLSNNSLEVNVAKNCSGMISVAGRCKNWDIVKYLITKGATINFSEEYHTTDSLYNLAISGKRIDILELLIKPEDDVNDWNYFGMNLLHYACVEQCWDVAEWLIENTNSDINKMEAYSKYTALHYAAEAGNIEFVTYLLQHGAVLLESFENKTATDYAVEKEHHDIVSLIKAHFYTSNS